MFQCECLLHHKDTLRQYVAIHWVSRGVYCSWSENKLNTTAVLCGWANVQRLFVVFLLSLVPRSAARSGEDLRMKREFVHIKYKYWTPGKKSFNFIWFWSVKFRATGECVVYDHNLDIWTPGKCWKWALDQFLWLRLSILFEKPFYIVHGEILKKKTKVTV